MYIAHMFGPLSDALFAATSLQVPLLCSLHQWRLHMRLPLHLQARICSLVECRCRPRSSLKIVLISYMRTGGAQPRALQAGEGAVAERVRAQGAAAGCRSLPVGG